MVISGSGFGASQGNSVVLLGGNSVPVNSWSDTSISIAIPTGAVSGYLVVSIAPSFNNSNPVTFTVTTQPLPAGWLDQDVGAVPSAGSVTYANAFNVVASGYLRGVAADSFHFVYQPVSGNATISARVANTDNWNSNGGVMMRETLDAAAKSVFIGCHQGGVNVDYRDIPSTTSSDAVTGGGSLPCWVKIVRTGNNFVPYTSLDGITWTPIVGTIPVSMASNIYVGLAVASESFHIDLDTVTFDSVSLTQSATTAPQISGVSSTTGSVGSQVVITGSNFGASQGNSQVLLNDSVVTVNSWSDTSITITIPAGATSGPLVVSTGSTASSNDVVFSVSSQPLPSGWFDQAIGPLFTYSCITSACDTHTAGTASYVGGVFSIYSAGTLGASDTFRFVYQPLSTDGSIVARIVSGATNNWEGVMMRATLDASSPEVSALASAANTTSAMDYRSSIGGPTTSVVGASGYSLPYWVKVSRSSNTFTAYGSSDGVNWTQLSSPQTFAAAQTVYVGLVHLPGSGVNTATFDNVSITAGGALPDPVVSGYSSGTAAPGGTITINGSGFGTSQGSSTVLVNGSTAAVSSWSDTQIVAVVPSNASTGPVSVTVSNITAEGPTLGVTFTAHVTDSLGHQSNYISGLFGGQWVVTSSDGFGCSTCTLRGTNSHQFDSQGNLLWTTDALGHTILYRYDSSNDVITESRDLDATTTATTNYTYNDFGQVLTVKDPLNHVTTNTYDGNGNLKTVTTPAPDGQTAASLTQFNYDNKGELTQITDPLNHVTTITYTTAGLIQTITDHQQHVTTYEYNARGDRTAIVDANLKRTEFDYDLMHRLTAIRYPDNNGKSVTFEYDSRGRRKSVTDQNNRKTQYGYDDADRLITVTDAALNVTTYGYDTESNLTSITVGSGLNQRTTTFDYDEFGRVKKTTFPSNLYESYLYDAIGNLTSKTDRKNQTISYVYDALNRLTHKGYPDSTGVDYIYDLVGKIQQVNDPSGTYSFAYDNMGRLIGTTTQYSFLPGHQYTNSYGYDAASNRTSFTAPDTTTVSYVYDTLNRLQTLTSSFVGPNGFGFGYDALSRRTSLTRPNGVNTTYNYDSMSRLQSVLHQIGATTIDGAAYTLDDAGNRSSKQNLITSVTENYTYDPIYQLTQVDQGGTTTESYSYDGLGNRLSSLGLSPYQYNSSNQLTSTPNATITYDNNGNTSSKTDSNGVTGYGWDYENRLTSVTLPGTGGTVTFKYDPFGRRIQKSGPTGTTIYLYDGANVVTDLNAAGAVIASYAQGAGIDEPLAGNLSGTLAFYEADGLGSITSLTDNSGSAVGAYTRDAFGKPVSTADTVGNRYRYTAREWDEETGLYYYRARYYDSKIGRFESEDPILRQPAMKRPSENAAEDAYAYVRNNSTNWFDPTGLVRWNCGVWIATVRSFPAVSAIRATCSSECFGGQRLVQRLHGLGGGGSYGIPLSATYSEGQLEDSYAFPYDFSLPGIWAYSGTGLAWGVLGGSFGGLRLGAATGRISLGWEAGVDLSVGAVGGVTVATSTNWESCKCRK